LNPVWVLLFLHERPTRWALIGGVIVLSAVTLRAISSVRARVAAGPIAPDLPAAG